MSNKPDNSQLWKYAGLVMQFFISIGIAVFVGIKLDGWMNAKIPLLAWILPLLVILSIIIKIMKDTSIKK